MTDSKLLERIIKKSGLKYKFIAEKLGLSYYGFRKKINNESDFTAPEIEKLCEILDIKSLEERHEIFFAQKVEF